MKLQNILALSIISISFSQTPPAIFYAPHQDDEAIGMAGGICEHKAAGRKVFLVLITNGKMPTNYQNMLNSQTCTWHNQVHNYGLTNDMANRSRTTEFIYSAKRLGVDSIFYINNGTGINEDELWGAATFNAVVEKIRDYILNLENKYPWASHKVTGPLDDPSGYGAHNALYQGAYQAKQVNPNMDFRIYRIYEYQKPAPQRTATIIMQLTSSCITKKKAALDEYKKLSSGNGRYAIGYHTMKWAPSAPNIIDSAYVSSYEYIDYLQ